MECNQRVMEEMQEKLVNARAAIGDVGSGYRNHTNFAANASAIQEIINVVQFLLDNAEWRDRSESTGNLMKESWGSAVRLRPSTITHRSEQILSTTERRVTHEDTENQYLCRSYRTAHRCNYYRHSNCNFYIDSTFKLP